jgi:hypothetical protein
MKKPEYQLVLQFPCNSSDDFDAVIRLEDRLLEELRSTDSEIDGHDAGSGEANIFILTENPVETFKLTHTVVQEFRNLAGALRCAFRRIDAEEYSALWPLGAKRFSVA